MSYLYKTYPHPHQVLPDDSFISVVVPTYCRPHYLEKLLTSLEQFADMPYEVVIHDDGSPAHLQEKVFKMRDRISILSFNTFINQGLVYAANHCISRASGKYVLFCNDDCFFVDYCLKDLCKVLAHPYIGVVSPMNDPGKLSDREAIATQGTRWAVSNFLGGGSCIAFRKEVWQEVGGWDDRSTSGQADNVFIYKILRAGYWKALLEGHDRMKVGNFVYGDKYEPTQGFSKGNDCSPPKIFGIPETELRMIAHRRREACQYWVDGERTIPNRHLYDSRPNPTAGLNDIAYWGDYFLQIFGGKHSHNVDEINWTVAERHSQAKWKEKILNDFRSS